MEASAGQATSELCLEIAGIREESPFLTHEMA